MRRLALALFYGVLSVAGLVSLAALVWAAIPSGSYVQYTSNDTVLMPAGTTFSAQLLNALGAFTASGSLTAGANMALTGIITPPQITAQQNNYNPTGLSGATVLRLSTNAVQHLTGLIGGTPGRLLLVHNMGTQNLVFDAESASSTTTSRFDFPGDLTLIPKAMVVLQYDGTDGRWRTSYPTLTAGPVNASLLNLTIQTGDPSPVASTLILYAKSSGVHTRDNFGNIVGPLGTGGGGGGTGVGLTARFVTTTQITRSGEITIEGILTSSSRVFVAGQTLTTENGLFITGGTPWVRASDALAGATFAAGTLVTITDGITGATGNKGTTWMYTSAGSYNTSALTSLKTGYGPSAAAFEQVANKGAISGYPSLGTDSMLTWTQSGSRATHAPVAAAGQITPTATTMGVEGSGGIPVTLTSGDPRITGCAVAADHGRKLTLKGTHATATLTVPNGQGVRLCGNTGSLVLGLNRQSADFVCEGLATPKEWQQINCPDLQQAKDVNRTITGATDLASALQVCNTANGDCLNFFGSTIQGTSGGAVIDQTLNIPAGKNLIIQGNGTEFERITAAGVHTYTGTAKPIRTVYIPAGAFETDQTVCSDPVRGTVNGSPKQLISCTDPGSDTPALYTDVLMPLSWDAGAISIVVAWFSASNLSAQHVDTDWNGFCVRDNDTVPTHTTTGVQSAISTFGNQSNDEQQVTTAAITLNGTCAAGAHIYIRGRMLAATNATMTNVRFLGIKLRYSISSRSD